MSDFLPSNDTPIPSEHFKSEEVAKGPSPGKYAFVLEIPDSEAESEFATDESTADFLDSEEEDSIESEQSDELPDQDLEFQSLSEEIHKETKSEVEIDLEKTQSEGDIEMDRSIDCEVELQDPAYISNMKKNKILPGPKLSFRDLQTRRQELINNFSKNYEEDT